MGKRHGFKLAPILAACAALALQSCSSLTDLGYVDHPAVADNIHAWVGQEAAAHVGAPISFANLTEDERTLRDEAFPLIQPAYARGRWDQVVYDYGQKLLRVVAPNCLTQGHGGKALLSSYAVSIMRRVSVLKGWHIPRKATTIQLLIRIKW